MRVCGMRGAFALLCIRHCSFCGGKRLHTVTADAATSETHNADTTQHNEKHNETQHNAQELAGAEALWEGTRYARLEEQLKVRGSAPIIPQKRPYINSETNRLCCLLRPRDQRLPALLLHPSANGAPSPDKPLLPPPSITSKSSPNHQQIISQSQRAEEIIARDPLNVARLGQRGGALAALREQHSNANTYLMARS